MMSDATALKELRDRSRRLRRGDWIGCALAVLAVFAFGAFIPGVAFTVICVIFGALVVYVVASPILGVLGIVGWLVVKIVNLAIHTIRYCSDPEYRKVTLGLGRLVRAERRHAEALSQARNVENGAASSGMSPRRRSQSRADAG
jgi:hypothetical protein